jgi:hypothetical protein
MRPLCGNENLTASRTDYQYVDHGPAPSRAIQCSLGRRTEETPSRSLATIRGMGRQASVPLVPSYILDKQARLQNVIVRLADVRLINIFEPMNQQAQIRQNLPVIRLVHFSKYL